jgi:hypothetical protein
MEGAVDWTDFPQDRIKRVPSANKETNFMERVFRGKKVMGTR